MEPEGGRARRVHTIASGLNHGSPSRTARLEPFVSGWLRADAAGRESVCGRPADVLVMPDGALLASDDHAGPVHRITYRAPNAR